MELKHLNLYEHMKLDSTLKSFTFLLLAVLRLTNSQMIKEPSLASNNGLTELHQNKYQAKGWICIQQLDIWNSKIISSD